MKLLLVLTVASAMAAPAPEADPAFAYSIGATPLVHHAALPLTYGLHHALPLAYSHVLPYAGCRNVEGALVPCAHSGVYGLPLVAAAAAPVAETPAEEEPAVVSVEKREAEADADPYLVYGYSGLHAPVVASAVYNTPVVKSVVHTAPVVKSVVHTAPAVTYATHAYHPYSAYSAYSPYGLYGRKKREAEAEAEPYTLYNYGGYAPLAYAHAYHPYAYNYAAYAGCRNNYGALVPCA